MLFHTASRVPPATMDVVAIAPGLTSEFISGPPSVFCENSIETIELNRMMSPTCTNTLLSYPATHTPKKAPNATSGVSRSTAHGSFQLSYCAASSRNTNTIARTNVGPAGGACFSW